MKKFLISSITAALVLMFALLAQAQQLEINFSHKLHAEDAGAACGDCHAAETSELASDDLLPAKDSCFNCHDSDAECSMCHNDVDNAQALPRVTKYIGKFPHARHISDDVNCETCHTGVANSEVVADEHLPKMPLCSSCHIDLEKPDYCYDCHDQGESLVPADHRLDWRKAHGVKQQNAAKECTICHTENQCLSCHKNDNLDRKAHPLNYINNHGMFAKGNKDQCMTCHEDQNYCLNCHREQLVMPRSHASAGWSSFKAPGGNHARAARADLDECLSCHYDAQTEPICVQCHTNQ